MSILHYTHSYLFFYGLLLSAFLVDLGQFFSIGIHVVPVLLCIHCILILDTNNHRLLICSMALQFLETFCFYNFFTLALLSIIPLTLLAYLFKKTFYYSVFYSVIFCFFAVLIQIWAIEGYFLNIWLPSYTPFRINATLVISISFSLINSWLFFKNNKG